MNGAATRFGSNLKPSHRRIRGIVAMFCTLGVGLAFLLSAPSADAAAIAGPQATSLSGQGAVSTQVASTAASSVAIKTATPSAVANTATPGPATVIQEPATAVSSEALPTVQIDGVVYAQVILNNTVYAGGAFANARPAGAAARTHLTARSNLLSYNLTTGALITTFAPNLNGSVRSLALTPDGTKLIVGGTFTTANGVTANRVAAYSTSTGKLITTFKPNVDGVVMSIVATNTTVYIGGHFSHVDGVVRGNLGAVSIATGGLLPNWKPSADYIVRALVFTPDHSMLIAGGSFQRINGAAAYGLAALRTTDGALRPWAAGAIVHDAGTGAGIMSLVSDGTTIYGTGYVYHGPATTWGYLEGTFAAVPNTGAIKWIEDCHGDTYGAYSDGTTVYTVSHAHYCTPVGGYPEPALVTVNMHHALAFTAKAAGVLGHDELTAAHYHDWAGTPSPALVNWFPDFSTGTVTGQGQAGWTITGNGQYVIVGGEFPTVNGVAQQGLVRFARRTTTTAAAQQGPMLSGSVMSPRLASLKAGTVRVTFPTDWDRDDLKLTYKIIRDGDTAHPAYNTTANSTFWNRPSVSFNDSGLVPGSVHTYQVLVSDPNGNAAASATVSVTAATYDASTTYRTLVLHDGATKFWTLGDAAGTKVSRDFAGLDDLTNTSSVGRGVTGPTAATTASSFDGKSSLAATATQIPSPAVFTEEGWFDTTSTTGGKIIGFGSSPGGASVRYDRHIYLDSAGRVYFGVAGTGTRYVLVSTSSYNDGQWHQVVGTLSSAGMTLYVDGQLIGTTATPALANPYSGYWRVGGDSSWTGAALFTGSLADIAIYPTVLTAAQVAAQYAAATAVDQPPVSVLSVNQTDLTVAVDGSASSDPDGSVVGYSWNFGDASAPVTTITATHTYAAAGTYTVKLTATDNQGVRVTTGQVITVTVPVVTSTSVPSTATSSTAVSSTSTSSGGATMTSDPSTTTADPTTVSTSASSSDTAPTTTVSSGTSSSATTDPATTSSDTADPVTTTAPTTAGSTTDTGTTTTDPGNN